MTEPNDPLPSPDHRPDCIGPFSLPGDAPDYQEFRPCVECRREMSATYIRFRIIDSERLLVDKINSPGGGWGKELVLALRAAYRHHNTWIVSSINPGAEGFWRKMADRAGIDLHVSGDFGPPTPSLGGLDGAS